MLAWRLFAHSVSLLWRNLRHAVRISLPIMLIGFAVGIVMVVVIGIFAGIVEGTGDFNSTSPGMVFVMIAASVIAFVAMMILLSWNAVLWHRFVLLEEYPTGFKPKWHKGNIVAYALKMLLLALIIMVPLLATFGVIYAALNGVESTGGSLVAVLIGIAVYLTLCVITYRLALVMPATAIGQPLGFADAMQATRGASGTILLLILFVLLLGVAINIPIQILSVSMSMATSVAAQVILLIVAMITNIALSWFNIMVGFSLLTTMYGYYVEKRELG